MLVQTQILLFDPNLQVWPKHTTTENVTKRRDPSAVVQFSSVVNNGLSLNKRLLFKES